MSKLSLQYYTRSQLESYYYYYYYLSIYLLCICGVSESYSIAWLTLLLLCRLIRATKQNNHPKSLLLGGEEPGDRQTAARQSIGPRRSRMRQQRLHKSTATVTLRQ